MWRRGRLVGVVAALACACLPAAAAEASRIVYVCAPNLCVVDPATGVSTPLTTDGTADSPYRDPSVSADGSRIAAARGLDVLVGAYGSNLTERWNGSQGLNDVALSPDGGAVAESHAYVQPVNRVFCYPFSGCQIEIVIQDMSAASHSRGVSAEGNTKQFAGGGGVGFLGNGALLTSFYTLNGDTHTVCVIATPDTPSDPPCGVEIDQVGATLSWPDGSRDSTQIVAVRGPAEGEGPSTIVLYDAATGAVVRELAQGTDPSFSPDGASVAFSAPDGSIAVVPTAGGAPRTLVAGTAPAWSDGAAPGASVTLAGLRVAKGRVPVAVRCEGGAACAGKVRLSKGRTTLGERGYKVAAGKSGTVRVRLTARGRRALSKGRKHRVTVRLAPAGGQPVTKQLTLRR